MSDYEGTDSDYDYNENEKILLDKARRGRPDEDSEEEVLNLPSSDEGDRDSFDEDIEDIEDNLPSSQAWGKRKKDYYNTDYVDEDFGGFQGKDAENAELEEKEARAIQERLLKEIDESDYMLDTFKKVPQSQDEQLQEKIETDISGLSKREKLALFTKESPEFAGLVQDFKVNMKECDEKLQPILDLVKEGKIPDFPICKFIKTKYDLSMNYCINILYYLLLKARRIPVQSHPVIKRLFQHKQLLKQLEGLDKKVLPQIDTILAKVANGEELKFDVIHRTNSISVKKPKAAQKDKAKMELEDGNIEEEGGDADENEDEDDEGQQRRAITYQIAKNKGLTPYRKKEYRNPRVKHRMKYRKALIRRKGQVREHRPELKKYGGEISGINIGIKKSIKLK